MKINIRHIKKDFIVVLFYVFIYKSILDWIYSSYISVLFNYMGFINRFTFTSFSLSYIYLLFTFPFFYSVIMNIKKVSEVALSVLYFISFIPLLTMYAYNSIDISFFYLFFIFWIVLLFCFQIISLIETSYIKLDISNKRTIGYLCIIFSIIIIFIFGYYRNFSFYLGLKEVYSLRLDARKFNIPTILAYLLGFSRATIPLFYLYYIINKKRKVVLILTIIQIANFSIDGMKTVIFITILTLLLGLLLKNLLIKNISKYAVIFIFFAKILELFNIDIILNLIIRRILFIPNLLSYFYYDYSQNKKPYLYRNILKFLGLNIEEINIPRIIGNNYFNAPEMNANTGLFGDAYINFGILGVIIIPIIISIIFYILNCLTKNLDRKINIITGLQIAFVLTSTSIPTMFLTHGYFMTFIVLWLLPRSENIRKIKND